MTRHCSIRCGLVLTVALLSACGGSADSTSRWQSDLPEPAPDAVTARDATLPPTDLPSTPSDVPWKPIDTPVPPADVPPDVPVPPEDVPVPPDVSPPPEDAPVPPEDVPVPPEDVPVWPEDVPVPPPDVPASPEDAPPSVDVPVLPADVPSAPDAGCVLPDCCPAGAACDDDDPCTVGDTCADGACAGTRLTGCAVVCTVTGAPGDEVLCPLRLARLRAEERPATSLRAGLRVAADDLALGGLVDLVCPVDGECTRRDLPETDATLFETGHAVTLVPASPPDGSAALAFAHATDPTVPLSPAYLLGDEVVGDAHLVSVRLSVQRALPRPAALVVYDVVARDEADGALGTAIVGDLVVTSDEGCATDDDCPEGRHCDVICVPDGDDGDPCDEPSDCASEHCDHGLCCAGGNCCVVPEDCPGAHAATCGDPSACQGQRVDTTCAAAACGTATVDDDSACTSDVVVRDCGDFADVTCTGATDQRPPADTCPTTCVTDAPCAPGAVCDGATCRPLLCTVAGAAGATVDCPLLLARTDATAPPAVQLALALAYPGALLVPEALTTCAPLAAPLGRACTAGGSECAAIGDPTVTCDARTLRCVRCTTSPLGDTATLATGHTARSCAEPPVSCAPDTLAFAFVSPTSTPLTTVVFAEGPLAGGELARVRFRLVQASVTGAPVTLERDLSEAVDARASRLPLDVRPATAGRTAPVLVTGAPDGAEGPGIAPYTGPDGDVDGSGSVDLRDVQCEARALAALAASGGAPCASDAACAAVLEGDATCRRGFGAGRTCLPSCLAAEVSLGVDPGVVCDDPEATTTTCLGVVQRRSADLDCDGALLAHDVLALAGLLLGAPGAPGPDDLDGDGRLDVCDDDSDGDGALDPEDCRPMDPSVGACDDGDPCTNDVCVDGTCTTSALSGGTCDDGDPCTRLDTCFGGRCAGTGYTCSDGNDCTADTCDGTGGCTYPNAPGACEDGDACTVDDTCVAGFCTPGPDDPCEDANPCTENGCDATDGCRHPPVAVGTPCPGGACDAAGVCRAAERCTDGDDNDGDGSVDCFDEDCYTDAACFLTCTADAIVACDRVLTGTTVGQTNQVGLYPSCSSRALRGGEWIVAFTPEATTLVSARVNAGVDLDLLLLPNACDSYACTERADTELLAEVVGGRTYYLAVDAPAGLSGAFTLTLQCFLHELSCGDGADEDGDGAADCADDDCTGDPLCVETLCRDRLDDDADGATDCADSDCHGAASCTCTAGATLACGGSVTATTVGRPATLDWYGCASAGTLTGPESVYAFTPATSGLVTARLVGAPEALDVLVLEDGCGGERCLAHGVTAASFYGRAGHTYYVVVDGASGASGAYGLRLECGTTTETACSDGADNDFDGRVDCADPDCIGSTSCPSPCGSGPQPIAIACGETVLATTAGQIDRTFAYSCQPSWLETGGEVVYRLVPTDGTRSVTATIAHGTSYDLDVFVLDDACQPLACLDGDDLAATTVVSPGTPYYVVVDGFMGAAGLFELTVECFP